MYRLEDKRSSNIASIIFSPDGKYVVTTSDYGARLWSLQTQDLIPDLCSRLTRNLRLDEWKQVFGELPYQETCPNLPLPEDLPTNSSEAKESAKPAKPPEVTPTPVASQPPPTPAETAPAATVSPSPRSYTFKFPQENCGDKLELAPPNALWYPVFIDNKSVEEVKKQYCGDAYPVSKREKTGKPSVQVASFSDRPKAAAFAREVGGEVGEPHH